MLAPTHIFMDLNYQRPGTLDITPGCAFFAYASQKKIPFLGISGRKENIALATAEGIPSLLTGSLEFTSSLRRFLQPTSR